MAKNNPTFALNVYNIVLGWFENIQYIYLDFEVVVFKLRDLQLLPQVLSNSNTTKKSKYWYYYTITLIFIQSIGIFCDTEGSVSQNKLALAILKSNGELKFSIR